MKPAKRWHLCELLPLIGKDEYVDILLHLKDKQGWYSYGVTSVDQTAGKCLADSFFMRQYGYRYVKEIKAQNGLMHNYVLIDIY